MSNPRLSNCYILLCFWERTALTIVQNTLTPSKTGQLATRFSDKGRREGETLALPGTPRVESDARLGRVCDRSCTRSASWLNLSYSGRFF